MTEEYEDRYVRMIETLRMKLVGNNNEAVKRDLGRGHDRRE